MGHSWIGATDLRIGVSAFRRMGVRRCVAIATMFFSIAALYADEPRIVAAEKPWIELPKEAVIHDRDDTGQRWKLSGELPVSLSVARRDFEVCLGRQGWKLESAIPTGTPGQRAELSTWTKGKRKLLLMLSEDAPGTSTFYLGEA